jgi:protease-4
LADRVGTLDDAIASAAKMAGTESYRTTSYPATKDPIQQLVDQFLNMEQTKVRQRKLALREQLGSWYPYLEFLQEVSGARAPQARLPFMIPFE